MALFHTKKGFFKAIAAGDTAAVADYLKTRHTDWLALKDGQGRSPLVAAVAGRQREVVQLLLADPRAAQITVDHVPVNMAIFVNRADILGDLLATGRLNLAAPNGQYPPVYYAVIADNLDCLKALLSAGADPNPAFTPADDRKGARKGLVNMDLHFYRESPVFRAVLNDNKQIADTLLQAGARFDSSELPLHCAAAANNLPLAERLLAERRYEVSKSACDGSHPLHVAAEHNALDVARLLMSKGASIAAANNEGKTPLSIAQQYLRSEMIAVLTGTEPAPAPKAARSQPEPEAKPEPAKATIPSFSIDLTVSASPAPPPAARGDEWKLTGGSRLTHVFEAPGHRLTEIFNFSSRERITLSENLALKAETMGPRDGFDAVSLEALSQALEEFRRQGGAASDGAVFGNRAPLAKNINKR